MRKRNCIYFVIAVIFTATVASCSSAIGDNDLRQTGLFDQNGNLITNTLIYTNKISFSGNIPSWATNDTLSYIIITNVVNKTNYHFIYETNYYLPSLPDSPTEYYKVRVPFARSGGDYVTVSYKDMATIRQLWLDQIFRKGAADNNQNVFAIRNRDNDGGYWFENNNFQAERDGRYDYYYFADNGDIVYKGGDKNGKTGETVVKKLVGATIVDYLKFSDHRNRTGEWTIGGIYKMAINVNDARSKFKGGGAAEGVYDFIAAPDGAYWSPGYFRQYYDTNFIEILVLNPYNNQNMLNCMGLDSYYPYYAEISVENHKEGAYPIKGFTEKNMPWMTEEYLYMATRPEWIIPYLNRHRFFSDWANSRWRFMVMPGHRD